MLMHDRPYVVLVSADDVGSLKMAVTAGCFYHIPGFLRSVFTTIVI